MNFDAHYYFVLYIYVLAIILVVQRVGFSIIHCFCLLLTGWLFCPCIWLSLLVLLNLLYIQHNMVFKLIQVKYVWDWVWRGPKIIHQTSLGNILDTAFLIAWFGHLVIPHGWLVLCLLMVDVVHLLVNNLLLTLYLVSLFYLHYMGFDEWFFSHKIMLIYCSYCSLSFPWHVIHFDSSYHLMCSLP